MKITDSRADHPPKTETSLPFLIQKWTPADVTEISRLERVAWPTWLRRTEESINVIANNYPHIQLLARDSRGMLVGTITANRIDWDGNPKSLIKRTWDEVADGVQHKGDYSTTYRPDGNTLCLMSTSVDPTMRGHGIATQLIEGMRNVAIESGIEHLVGPFRPSGYGNYKLRTVNPVDIADYCKMTDADGQPVDPWIKFATRQGMIQYGITDPSMTVVVDKATFDTYRDTLQPTRWKKNEDGTWECGETGRWRLNGDYATYTEPNLWGEIPLHSTLAIPEPR